MNKFTALLLIFVLLAGCCIEKRHYRKGYSVEWFTKKSSASSHTKSDFKKVGPIESESVNTISSLVETPATFKKDISPLREPEATKQKKHRAKHKIEFNFPVSNYAGKNYQAEKPPPAGGQSNQFLIIVTLAAVGVILVLLSISPYLILGIILFIIFCITIIFPDAYEMYVRNSE